MRWFQGSRGRALVVGTLVLGGCGGLGGRPPDPLPVVKGADGREYRLLDRGAYKGFYDAWGRLQRIEYDSNKDGRPDQVAFHDGGKHPYRIEVDEDFDGKPDRWEDYSDGKLVKVGVSRRGQGPDLWQVLATDGVPRRREYDDDGDGRVERTEILGDGRVVRLEVDADRDGRTDRWQNWAAGRLVTEDLDTDGSGRADRRLEYGPAGRITASHALE